MGKPCKPAEPKKEKKKSLREIYSKSKEYKEMMIRRKCLNEKLAHHAVKKSTTDPPSTSEAASSSTSCGAATSSSTSAGEGEGDNPDDGAAAAAPALTKMEHYKKRLIHQMEQLEQERAGCGSPAASGSDSAAEDEGRIGDRKGKKARKKRISRKLFRHQDIELFSPKCGKPTSFLRQIQHQPPPQEKVSNTNTIVQMLQKTIDNKTSIGKHHLPPTIFDYPYRRNEVASKYAQKPVQTATEQNNNDTELLRSKSANVEVAAKVASQRRKTVCTLDPPLTLEDIFEVSRYADVTQPKPQPISSRRKTFCVENDVIATTNGDEQVPPNQFALDLTKRSAELRLDWPFIKYNPLTINELTQDKKNEEPPLPQPKNKANSRQELPEIKTFENDNYMKVFSELLPGFVENNNTSAVLMLQQKIALFEDRTLSPSMQKIKAKTLADIHQFLTTKKLVTNENQRAASNYPTQRQYSDPIRRESDPQIRISINPDIFRNVEALATPSSAQNQTFQKSNESSPNTSPLRTYRRQLSAKSEPYTVEKRANYTENAPYNGNFIASPYQMKNNPKTILTVPYTTTDATPKTYQYNKTQNGVEITPVIEEPAAKTADNNDSNKKQQVHFLIPSLRVISKDEIPSITEKVIPAEVTNESMTPIAEKMIKVQINSNGTVRDTQNLIVIEKEIQNGGQAEKGTTTRGTSPVKQISAGKSGDEVEIVEMKEKIEITDKHTGGIVIKTIDKKLEEPIEIFDERESPYLKTFSLTDLINRRWNYNNSIPPSKKTKTDNSISHDFTPQFGSLLSDLNKNYISNPLENSVSPLRTDETVMQMQTRKPMKKIQELSSHDVKNLLKSNIVAKITPLDAQKAKNLQHFATETSKTNNCLEVGKYYKAKIEGKNIPENKLPRNGLKPNDFRLRAFDLYEDIRITSTTHPEYSTIVRRDSFDTSSNVSDHSSYQDELKSPIEKRVRPRGKLRYDRMNNTLERYFDDVQEKLYFQNVVSEDEMTHFGSSHVEVIKIPHHVQFHREGTIDDVAEFIDEFKQVEMYAPSDFSRFYRYVAGYQMLNGQVPIAFKTFLDLFNTKGLDNLLAKYLCGGQ